LDASYSSEDEIVDPGDSVGDTKHGKMPLVTLTGTSLASQVTLSKSNRWNLKIDISFKTF